MATVKKLQIKMTLSNGKTAYINLPEAINNNLTDPDSGDTIPTNAMPAIAAAYATDLGATVVSAKFIKIETTTSALVNGATFDSEGEVSM